MGVSDGRKILLRNRKHVREFFNPEAAERQATSEVEPLVIGLREPPSTPNSTLSRSENEPVTTEQSLDNTPSTVSDSSLSRESRTTSGSKDTDIAEKEPESQVAPRQTLYKEVMTGRTVKLTMKAKESNL